MPKAILKKAFKKKQKRLLLQQLKIVYADKVHDRTVIAQDHSQLANIQATIRQTCFDNIVAIVK